MAISPVETEAPAIPTICVVARLQPVAFDRFKGQMTFEYTVNGAPVRPRGPDADLTAALLREALHRVEDRMQTESGALVADGTETPARVALAEERLTRDAHEQASIKLSATVLRLVRDRGLDVAAGVLHMKRNQVQQLIRRAVA